MIYKLYDSVYSAPITSIISCQTLAYHITYVRHEQNKYVQRAICNDHTIIITVHTHRNERQKGLTTSHVNTQLNPFASKLAAGVARNSNQRACCFGKMAVMLRGVEIESSIWPDKLYATKIQNGNE